MKLLEKMVISDGKVYDNNVLKVDSFLNHQIDPKLMNEMAKVFYSYFKEKGITKVLTIEASGIAPAILVSYLLEVPMVFAKKSKPSTITGDNFYSSSVYSYTKNITSNIIVSKDYISKNDNVLIIDDFLANGEAVRGLVEIVDKAEANVSGIGILVEKSFQKGRLELEKSGFDICSLCRIASLEKGKVIFNKADDEK